MRSRDRLSCRLWQRGGPSVLIAIDAAKENQDVLTIDRYAHLVGGCRMGFEPEWSVVDSDHRVWGMPNLFVCDGSVMPSGGRGGR